MTEYGGSIVEVIAKKYEQRDEKGETMALLKMLIIL